MWREGLLAQKAIFGEGSAYSRHPQLRRFLDAPDPRAAIVNYLLEIWKEGCKRGYRFDSDKIRPFYPAKRIPLTRGQLEYERKWLRSKLMRRCPSKAHELDEGEVEAHPLFFLVEGKVEGWERERPLEE